MAVYIKIDPDGAPHETLKRLLSRCWRDRGDAPILTTTPYEGHYYARIDNVDVLRDFRGQLKIMNITHLVANALPGGRELRATPMTPPSTGSLLNEPPVRTAVVDFLVELFRPRGPFDL